jgi:hypothetical protein
MRGMMVALYVAMLAGMSAITLWASLDRGMLDAGGELLRFPWFVATLADAYFAFLAFYLWLAWRESTWTARLLWLVLVLTLGSIAIAGYMLIQLYKRRGEPLAAIWQRDECVVEA